MRARVCMTILLLAFPCCDARKTLQIFQIKSAYIGEALFDMIYIIHRQ